MRPAMGESHEVHVTVYPHSGHAMSRDCWCEPTDIFFDASRQLTVVRHVDRTPAHRNWVNTFRDQHRMDPTSDFRSNEAWITRALEAPDYGKE